MKPEILAPAGSIEALRAAVHAGADAVYLGGERFGARAYAGNFDESALIKAIEYSHLYGVKVYLTINTLFRNDEIRQLFDYLSPYYEAGLDAVIVQDLGVMDYVHQNFPDLPIHASTQMTITTKYAYKLLQKYGVTRIVPARELSISEIRKLKEDAVIPEVEVFVQGALCYCYSGQCLMSSMLGGRSGNRGRCAQTCRLPYTVFDQSGKQIRTGGEHVLSPKDLCGLDIVEDLVEAGVDSFKIEGRMKKPEYVAACVRAYRNVVDLWYDKRNPSDDGNAMNRKRKADEYVSGATEVLKNPSIDSQQEKITEKAELEMIAHQYKQEMAEVFNRGGFTKGYFYRHNGKEMMSIKNPGNVGVVIGTVVDIRKNQICVRLDQTVYKGDILVLDGKKQEITLTSNIQASEGEIITLNAPRIQEIRKKQTVRRMLQYPLMKELEAYFTTEKKVPICGKIVLTEGETATLTLTAEIGDRKYSVMQSGELVQTAEHQPLTEEIVKDKVGKMGNTRYEFHSLQIILSSHAFYSLKALKDLRRSALAALETTILEAGRRVKPKPVLKETEQEGVIFKQLDSDKNRYLKQMCVMLSSMEQYMIVKQEKQISEIYLDLQFFSKEAIIEIIKGEKERTCYVVLPPVLRSAFVESVTQLLAELMKDSTISVGVVVRNIDELAYLKQIEYHGNIVTDHSLYVMNDYAVRFVHSLFPEARITLPVELNQMQLKTLLDTGQVCEFPLTFDKNETLSGSQNGHNFEIEVYGYQQLMVSAQCLQSTLLRCDHKNAEFVMRDRYHKSFFVTNICKYCYSLIYNGVPTILYDLVSKDFHSTLASRLHFTRESKEETKTILDSFFSGRIPEEEKTRGHYHRGVE